MALDQSECKAFWENSRCPHVTELPRQLVNLHNFYAHISASICVCMHVYVCVYVLAMGLDPSKPRQCFASCWAWEKDGTPFHSCLGQGLGCWGPLYPLCTQPRPPLSDSPPPLSIPFRLQPTCFQKQDPLPSPS